MSAVATSIGGGWRYGAVRPTWTTLVFPSRSVQGRNGVKALGKGEKEKIRKAKKEMGINEKIIKVQFFTLLPIS